MTAPDEQTQLEPEQHEGTLDLSGEGNEVNPEHDESEEK